MAKILDVKNLRISFRTNNGTVKAVRDVSFDLEKGETLAIVGESGSGKSVTSRAIMGILAPNAIVESGEIIFDGKDLLQISESEFHTLRGEKLSMIFQDPLSSLNPIVKIGKQLTEAMIIKGKSKQKKAAKKFKGRLDRLNQFMDLAMDAENDLQVKAANQEAVEKLKNFVKTHCGLEEAYNVAREALLEALDLVGNLIFEIEKGIAKGIVQECSKICKLAQKTVHRYVVHSEAERLTRLLGILQSTAEEIKSKPKFDAALDLLNEINAILDRADKFLMPDFFAMGYYLTYCNEPLPELAVKELNDFLKERLDNDFLNDFKQRTKKGIIHSAQQALKYKKEVIELIDKSISTFERDTLNKTETDEVYKRFHELVFLSFDRLALTRDSVAYSFRITLKNEVGKYFYGLKNNQKEQNRFDKQNAKYEEKTKAGKVLNWRVTPASIIDLEVCKQNIVNTLKKLKTTYENDIASFDSIDWDEEVIKTIEFFKTKAQDMVFRVTKAAAKIKALKMMEEVGIADARRRYNQYPFQFSGGMRQRMVIAIALLVRPEILICDEPTTALDVTIQSQILELITELKSKFNLSVIFITHDLGVVANMADRVAVMYAGKIVEIGKVEEVFYSPQHPYTWALLSSMPDLNTKEKLEAIPGTPPNMIYPPKGDAFAARNKYAMRIDFEQQPPYFEVSPTHKAATWLLHPDAPKVEVPKIVAERIERNKIMREELKKENVAQVESESAAEQEDIYQQAAKIFGGEVRDGDALQVEEVEADKAKKAKTKQKSAQEQEQPLEQANEPEVEKQETVENQAENKEVVEQENNDLTQATLEQNQKDSIEDEPCESEQALDKEQEETKPAAKKAPAKASASKAKPASALKTAATKTTKKPTKKNEEDAK